MLQMSPRSCCIFTRGLIELPHQLHAACIHLYLLVQNLIHQQTLVNLSAYGLMQNIHCEHTGEKLVTVMKNIQQDMNVVAAKILPNNGIDDVSNGDSGIGHGGAIASILQN